MGKWIFVETAVSTDGGMHFNSYPSEDREDVLILLDNGVALYPDGIIGITDWLAVNTQTKVSLIGQVRPFSIEKPCNTCVIRIKDVTLHGGKEKKRQNQEQ